MNETMKPRVSADLLTALRQGQPPPPWKCKLVLQRGRTVYGAQITADGTIEKIGGRPIYTEKDLGFSLASLVDVIPY